MYQIEILRFNRGEYDHAFLEYVFDRDNIKYTKEASPDFNSYEYRILMSEMTVRNRYQTILDVARNSEIEFGIETIVGNHVCDFVINHLKDNSVTYCIQSKEAGGINLWMHTSPKFFNGLFDLVENYQLQKLNINPGLFKDFSDLDVNWNNNILNIDAYSSYK